MTASTTTVLVPAQKNPLVNDFSFTLFHLSYSYLTAQKKHLEII
jgi:hypothetical protein